MPETRTIEQAEHIVETVEHTEVQCPNCNQWYDEDDLHDVKIDGTETTLCDGCSSAVFGHDDGPQGLDDTQSDSTSDTGSNGTAMTSMIITVVVGITALKIGLDIINEVMQTIEPSSTELQQASEQIATGTTGDVFGLFGAALFVLIVSVVLMYPLTMGPRY